MSQAQQPNRWELPEFRTVQVLGSGASGEVVEAVDVRTGTEVAVKYLSETLRADTTQLEGFRKEARLLQQIDSAHVTRLYEYQEHGSGAAIVMELVKGTSLGRLLREQGPLPPEAALGILKGSLLGLSAAHSAGIVHRDYKPGNVLVAPDGTSKLVDFGIAVRRGAEAPCAGTPAYMAPEQWQGRPPSPATDIYAVSATFYECLTGYRPYQGDTLHELAVQHMTAPVPVGRVPDPLRPLLVQGLAKDPAERPADADTFLTGLDEAAAAAYGPDWEERGKRALAALIALTPLLWPLSGGSGGEADAHLTAMRPEPAPDPAGTTLTTLPAQGTPGARPRPHGQGGAAGAGRTPVPRRIWVTAAAGVATVALIGGGVAAVTASDGNRRDAAHGTADHHSSAPSAPGTESGAASAGPSASASASASGSPSAHDPASPSGGPSSSAGAAGDVPHSGGAESGGVSAGSDSGATAGVSGGASSGATAGAGMPDTPSAGGVTSSGGTGGTSGSPTSSGGATTSAGPTGGATTSAGPTGGATTSAGPTGGATTSAGPTGGSTGGAEPPAPAPPAVEHVGVTALSSDGARRATARVIVWTEGTGPVTLTVRWYDAPAGASAQNPGRQEASETLTLSGKTRYEVTVSHLFDREDCTPNWGVLASTSPGAAKARPYRTTPASSCRSPFS